MAEPDKNTTTLKIPVPALRRCITAVIEPALQPEQQQAVDAAARKEHELKDVVRVLMTHTAHHGCSVRSIGIEDID
jgi:hypothetical protein